MAVNLSKRSKIVLVVVPVIVAASLIGVFAFYYMENIAAETQITELYRDILKREPDHAGLSYYKDQIIKNEKSLQWVEQDIRNSPEAITLRIAELYRDILKREADPEGMRYYHQEVTQNGKSLQWVEDTLRNSPEAKLMIEMKTVDELGDETKRIVDDLYREVLDRPVDREGLEYFGSLLESGKITVEDIRKALLESDEYKAMN
ncbi:MAG: DUF4214 domain-containing protein [Nitrosopumilaceae archaeon]